MSALTYTTTGSFQYDLGILGIVNILQEYNLEECDIDYKLTNSTLTIYFNVDDEESALDILIDMIIQSYFKDYLLDLAKMANNLINKEINNQKSKANNKNSKSRKNKQNKEENNVVDGNTDTIQENTNISNYKDDVNNFINDITEFFKKPRSRAEILTFTSNLNNQYCGLIQAILSGKAKSKSKQKTEESSSIDFDKEVRSFINKVLFNFCSYSSKPKEEKKSKKQKENPDNNSNDKRTENSQIDTEQYNITNDVKRKLQDQEEFHQNHHCSFCGASPSRRISRDVFFFAPSHINMFWFYKPNLYICKKCIISSLAVYKSFLFKKSNGKGYDFVALYNHNLKLLKELYDNIHWIIENKLNDQTLYNIKEEIYEQILKYLILDSNYNLQEGNTSLQFFIVNGNTSGDNSSIDFVFVNTTALQKFGRIKQDISFIYSNRSQSIYKENILIGKIKHKKLEIKKYFLTEILNAFIQNKSLLEIFLQYAPYTIESFKDEINDNKDAQFQNFNPNILLRLIYLHNKLEVDNMEQNEVQSAQQEDSKKSKETSNLYQTFIRLGSYIQEKLDSEKEENAAKNRKISLATQLMSISDGSYREFIDMLGKMIITYDLPLDIRLLRQINESNFRDLATIFAVAIISNSKKNGANNQKETQAKE